MQLGMICDSVLYAYLSKSADTAAKRHNLKLLVSQAAVDAIYQPFDSFRNHLHELKVFDPQPSDFQSYDLSVLLVILQNRSVLGQYVRTFRSNPWRSREFYYETRVWITFAVTCYMRYLRTLSNSR